jgi:Zn-dependent M28 family amino/carboxypeptidase
MVYVFLLVLLVACGFWGYKAMIDIRPEVSRPQMGVDSRLAIEDLEPRLKAHVESLANGIGERNIFVPQTMEAAAGALSDFWEKTGYRVDVQSFQVGQVTCVNLAVEILGETRPNEIVVVGAHYDTVTGSPGANDNGSAVAAMLELSRLFKGQSTEKTLRFVAFANEEPPFFKTRSMGSFVYAERCSKARENIVAMLSLETIGYYRDEPGTQKYPFPFRFFYPHTGNFITVVGNLRSKPLVQSFSRHFMEASDFPLECAAPFGFLTGIDWSDQWSFWRFGYPAVMITDTALFRYPYYHSPFDTPDRVDYQALARVTHGIYEALDKRVRTRLS